MIPKDLSDALIEATTGPGSGLAQAALLIARIEYPHLDPEPYLEKLDAMGEGARRAMERRAACSDDKSPASCVQALNEYLFDEQGFEGNRQRYEDPAQQLPERGAGAAHGHPDHAVGRLHGGGAAGRPPHRGRELPRPLPGALQGRGRTSQRGPDHRPVPRGAPC